MKPTKEQILKLFYFLNTLVESNIEIKNFEIMGDDILIKVEPLRGEIDNRVWRIMPTGELKDSTSFFYD